MKSEKDMIKWLNNLKNDIGQPQHSQLWHYVEVLDVMAKYLETTERTGKWIERIGGISGELFYQCSKCYGEVDTNEFDYCPWCGAKMKGDTE